MVRRGRMRQVQDGVRYLAGEQEKQHRAARDLEKRLEERERAAAEKVQRLCCLFFWLLRGRTNGKERLRSRTHADPPP